jgi:hypothetical protein
MAAFRQSNPEAAKWAVLELASRTTEPDEVLRAAGFEVARLRDQQGIDISEFDMRDMTRFAAEAFFEWQA